MVSQHEFLSEGWVEAATAIRAEYADQTPDVPMSMRANVVVTDVPFEDGEILGFVDTSDGSLVLERGELEDPELTIKLDNDTAKALFVAQDPAKVMESFMLGKILVTGDVSKLLSMTPPPVEEGQMSLASEIAKRLDAITAD